MDSASYAASATAVDVNLLTGAASGVDADGDIFSSIENLIGSSLGDTLTGDDGPNVIRPGGGVDIVDGGGDKDTVSYATSSLGVTVDLLTHLASGGDAQGDQLQNIENVIGSALGDTLTGDGGDNVFAPGAGDDDLEGGVGVDTVSYAEVLQAVSVNLSALTDQATGATIGTDQLTGIENVIGGINNDVLVGDVADNVLMGNLGKDSLAGGDGAGHSQRRSRQRQARGRRGQ